MKKIAILGASGSIGRTTINFLKTHKEMFSLEAFSVYNNTSIIASILDEFKEVKLVSVKDLSLIKDLIIKYPHVEFAENDLVKVSTYEVDAVLNALVGFTGLIPTIEAIKAHKDILLANKETLVAAGEIITNLAKEYNVNIIPVDSEHSAIFQCLEDKDNIKNIILTCSGGPFNGYNEKELENVTSQDALKHPSWNMGNKITIDSATLFNKAYEIIEAYYLFNVSPENIKVSIHKESIVHSLIEFKDGALKAILSNPDMSLPIAYSLTYPKRVDNVCNFLDMDNLNLSFYKPNNYQQKVLDLAYFCLNKKGMYPSILNGANDMANELFLNGKIKYLDVYKLVKNAIDSYVDTNDELTVENIIKANNWARNFVKENY